MMKTASENSVKVGHEEIAESARLIWEREGRQAGRDLEYWLQAERELNGQAQAAAAATRSPEASRTNKAPTSRGRTIHI
jgi:hypothetical protein